MTRPICWPLDRCSSCRFATFRRWWSLALALAALVSSGSAGFAQFSEDLAISVAPNPATTDEPVVVTVTGSASCPHLFEPVNGEGYVEIGFSGTCPILPPGPVPFTLFTLLGPFDPGIWEIRLLTVIDVPHNPPVVEDTVTLTVLDPRFSVELVPSPATEDDELVARVAGVAHDPILLPPEIEPGKIRIQVVECGLCDPPSSPAEFLFEQPLGQLDAGDYLVELFYIENRVAESVLEVLPGGSGCVPGKTVLCLVGGRFRVEATWTTPDGLSGPAMAVEETDDTGLFWFFSPDNIEMVVKVLDACDTEFETFWVFAGGLTDVDVRLEVTDTVTGEIVRYQNPQGRPFETVTDTAAFATCQ